MKYDSGGIARHGCWSSISLSNVVPLRETPSSTTGGSRGDPFGGRSTSVERLDESVRRDMAGVWMKPARTIRKQVGLGFRRFGYSRQSAEALRCPCLRRHRDGGSLSPFLPEATAIARPSRS